MESEQLSLFSSDGIKEEIEKLRKEIEYHNKRYYDDDNPEISDYEYDKLSLKFIKLEKEQPEYSLDSSPTK